jgi:hypothetical protein
MEWMDGWVDGWMDGRMEWVDGWMDGWMDWKKVEIWRGKNGNKTARGGEGGPTPSKEGTE